MNKQTKISFLAAIFLWSIACHGQGISITNFETANYPEVTASFSANNSSGGKIVDFAAEDFIVTEDGVERDVIDVSCPTAADKQVSCILLLDVSNSMKDENIEYLKQGAGAWIKSFNPEVCETAIIAFADEPEVLCPFTRNKDKLNYEIDNLNVGGHTYLDEAFLSTKAGAYRSAKLAEGECIIILLSDGVCFNPPDSVGIIQGAVEAGVTVYSVIPEVEVNPMIKELVRTTGGKYYDEVISYDEAGEIFRSITHTAEVTGDCKITWLSDGCRSERTVKLELPEYGVETLAKYEIDELSINQLFVEPENSLDFGIIEPGNSSDLTLILKTGNLPFEITDITCDNDVFQIVSPTDSDLPINLDANSEYPVKVRFTPIDSGYTYGLIEVVGDGCSDLTTYCTGGSKKIISGSPGSTGLEVVSPNGGEVLVGGSKSAIRWKGVPPDTKVNLDFSSDGGDSWQSLYTDRKGHSRKWDSVPMINSGNCLVRVSADAYLLQETEEIEPELLYRDTDDLYPEIFDLTSDENTAAILCDDNKMIIKDLQNDKVLVEQIFEPHTSFYDKISDVDISPDNKIVATAGGQVNFRDIATGDLIGSIRKDFRYYRSSEFSKDGKQIITAGIKLLTDPEINAVQIWDIASGDELAKYEIGAYILKVSQSPDGTKIAVSTTVTKEDSLIIINISSGNRTAKYCPGIQDFTWSPDGTKIAIRHNENALRILDANTLDVLSDENVESQFGLISFPVWSPDGKYIAVNPTDAYSVSIKDAESFREVCRLFIKTGGTKALQISWAANSKALFTTGLDNSFLKWDVPIVHGMSDISDAEFTISVPEATTFDVNFGTVGIASRKDSLIYRYISNDCLSDISIDSVTIEYDNPDNDRVFSVSSRVFPTIINAGEQKEIQLSYSPTKEQTDRATLKLYFEGDSIQSILQGQGVFTDLKLLADNIDFGDVFIPETQTIEKLSILKNISDVNTKIDSLIIGTENKNAFTCKQISGNILAPGDTLFAELSFTPTRRDLIQGLLLVYHSGVETPMALKLTGNGKLRKALVYPGKIDFGEVLIHNTKDSIDAILIKNEGDADLRIESVSIAGDTPEAFSTGELVGKVIPENETLKIPVAFLPVKTESFSAELVIKFEHIEESQKVDLSGRGIFTGTVSFDLSAPQISAYPNETIEVVLSIDNLVNIEYLDESNLSFDLIYNPTMLLPLGRDYEIISDSTAKTRITGSLEEIYNGVFEKVAFQTALGNAEYCDLRIDNLSVSHDNNMIQTEHGSFTLQGLCYEGGTRLLQVAEPNTLSVNPNPIENDVLEVTLSANSTGSYSIEIYNYAGQKVASSEGYEKGRIERKFEFESAHLSAGVYIVVYHTEYERISKIVIKK